MNFWQITWTANQSGRLFTTRKIVVNTNEYIDKKIPSINYSDIYRQKYVSFAIFIYIHWQFFFANVYQENYSKKKV
jgi:hypothetical protein